MTVYLLIRQSSGEGLNQPNFTIGVGQVLTEVTLWPDLIFGETGCHCHGKSPSLVEADSE